jgi:cytochrome c oxidase subunit 2
MFASRSDLVGTILVLATLIGIPVWVLHEESRANRIPDGENLNVINLTAVAKGGIFTFDEVVGYNYWWREPEVARPVVRVGETVLFRLRSADVTHGFSIPELNVGPAYMEPGEITEVRFVPEESGEYLIQCTNRCGCCHEEMFAILEVRGPNGEPPPEDMKMTLPPRQKCKLHRH